MRIELDVVNVKKIVGMTRSELGEYKDGVWENVEVPVADYYFVNSPIGVNYDFQDEGDAPVVSEMSVRVPLGEPDESFDSIVERGKKQLKIDASDLISFLSEG